MVNKSFFIIYTLKFIFYILFLYLEIDKNRPVGKTITTNSDQVIMLINDRLLTGYHGVKYLFNANDIFKTGKLTKLF